MGILRVSLALFVLFSHAGQIFGTRNYYDGNITHVWALYLLKALKVQNLPIYTLVISIAASFFELYFVNKPLERLRKVYGARTQ